jgi:hypothetical protein
MFVVAVVPQFPQQRVVRPWQRRDRAQRGRHGLQVTVLKPPLSREASPDHSPQFNRIKRLGDILVRRGDERQLIQPGVGRHDNTDGLGRDGADLLEQLAALHLGHELVGQNEIWRLGPDSRKRLQRVFETRHLPLRIHATHD